MCLLQADLFRQRDASRHRPSVTSVHILQVGPPLSVTVETSSYPVPLVLVRIRWIFTLPTAEIPALLLCCCCSTHPVASRPYITAMPHKILGMSILSDRQLPQPRHLHTKQSPNSSTTDLRRSSMEFKRPAGLVQLAKKHSSDKKDQRSRSKDKHGRSSVPGSRHTSPARSKPLILGVHMESPPVFFIGPPQSSTGAIITGRLQITPQGSDVVLSNVTMYLESKSTTKRPVESKCPQCTTQVSDLCEWNFFSKPKTFAVADGQSELPFSHLLPGHLPATTHGQIASLDYSLHVKATTSDNQTFEFRRELEIRRALIPGNDKNSTRIFPPTDLTLYVTLPHMIHPIGEFPVQCRMTGLVTKRDDTQTRWRLRKLTWRIEEHEKAVSPACPKHAHKVGGEGKGIQHENSREIGMQELKSGWKTDFEAADGSGQAEGEFLASIDKKLDPNCGVESAGGALKVSHHLVLELVIAEEWAPNKKPSQATPTGAARVLRTQFNLNVTERAGMGLSWDEEQPPMYEDVEGSPPHYPVQVAKTASLLSYEDVPTAAGGSGSGDSPPHYAAQHTRMMDYEGDDLHEDVEHLNLDSP